LENNMTDFLQQLNDDMADIVDRVRGSLVQVHNGPGAGAGTIWHPDGLIVTNAHVVAGHRELNVTLPNGETLPAKVIAQDSSRDLAALAVDATGLPTIELGDSRQLRPGQWVMALGHPWGVMGALTSGAVITTGTNLPEVPVPDREWIVAGLHLRPGHSGGPMVDTQGRLIGINTMINGPDVGFAVPVHVVKGFLKETIGSRDAAVA
jgi:serine protease Do